MKSEKQLSERGLPNSPDAERFILGSLLLSGGEEQTKKAVESTKAILPPDDFHLYANRVIYESILDLDEKNVKIDRVTLADDLIKRGKLEAVGGLSYLIELDNGLPQIFNLDSYVNIVRSKARLRAIIYAADELIGKATKGEDEPDELLRYMEERLSNIGSTSNLDCGKSLGEFIDQYPGGTTALLDFKNRMRGLSTGFPRIDELTGGLLNGSVTTVAGWPGTGKSAFALNIARNMADNNGEVVIFSPEMTYDPIFNRFLARESGISMSDLRDLNPSGGDRAAILSALSTLSSIGIRIDDSSGISPADIYAKISSLRSKKKIKAVIIDYFQLLSPMPGIRYSNDNERQIGTSNALMLIAKKTGIPFIVLSQLRKKGTNEDKKEPELDDLFGSGLGRDSWLVIILRSMAVPERLDTKGNITAYLKKNRLGDMLPVKLRFDGGKAFFSEDLRT